MALSGDSFRPAPYLRNGHLQTILASSSFRAWGNNPMCDGAAEMIIEASGGVRLLGLYSPQKSNSSKGNPGMGVFTLIESVTVCL